MSTPVANASTAASAPSSHRMDPDASLPAGDAARLPDDVDDEFVEPEWVWIAAANFQREQIVNGRDGIQDGDAISIGGLLTAIGLTDPDALAESGDTTALLAGIRGCERLIGHMQAVQQRWLAAFARPGVAVSGRALVRACVAGRGRSGIQPLENLVAELPGAAVIDDDLVDVTGDDLDACVWGRLPRDRFGQPDLDALSARPGWNAALSDTAARLASMEIGCLLGMSPITARIHTERALSMVDDLATTLSAQQAGELDGYRARLIADGTRDLPPAVRQAVEERVLPLAAGRTPTSLRNLITQCIIDIDPEAAAEKAAQARQRRGVSIEAGEDDMATLRGVLHAADARLAYGVLDDAATTLKTLGLADGRGTSQLRADILVDMFHSLDTTGHASLDPREWTWPSTPGATSGGQSTDQGNHGHGPAGSLPGARQPGWASRGAGTGTTDDAEPRTSTSPACGTKRQDDQDATTRHSDPGSVTHHADPDDAIGDHDPDGAIRHVDPDGAIGRRTCLNVYIDAATLAGLAEHPGELAGYGVITAATARDLAASAASIRALVTRPAPSPDGRATGDVGAASDGSGPDERWPGMHSTNRARSRTCGSVIDAGRRVYRPPDRIYHYVTARDRTCQFPGCRAAAERCDIDHRHPYDEGGATCACNLDLLCRVHHHAKTFTPWRATPGSDGSLTWTSPTGHRYATESSHPLVSDGRACATPIDDPPPF